MKNFILNNWSTILLAFIFIAYVVFHIVTKQWSKLREMAYKLMLAIEKSISGSVAGKEKFELVFERIYSLIPLWFKLFVPPDELRRKLQEWYILAKDELDDGKLNNSIK
jgi:hypothetical protein